MDPEDGYPDFIESGTQEELQLAIEDMDRMLEEGNTIITNYETLTPLLSNGTVLDSQLNEGLVVAQPKVTADFSMALEDAAAYELCIRDRKHTFS